MKQIIHSAAVTAVIAVVVALTVTIVDSNDSDTSPSTPNQDNARTDLAADQPSSPSRVTGESPSGEDSEPGEVGIDTSSSTSSSTTLPWASGPPGSEDGNTTTSTVPVDASNDVRFNHLQRKLELRDSDNCERSAESPSRNDDDDKAAIDRSRESDALCDAVSAPDLGPPDVSSTTTTLFLGAGQR